MFYKSCELNQSFKQIVLQKMQQLMCFALWLSVITIINCKFSEKPQKSHLEWNTGNQKLGEKIQLETVNKLNVKQFEPFNISVDVTVNSLAGNYSNGEVRVCY